MNHVRNIKEMLSIQTGSRNAPTSRYSSLTDSQLFFGSQFWPENSQGLSQDLSVSSRNSQQSSQEGSDPKFSSSYQAKPLLFGDRSKAFGVLDKFEEEKTRAKEKKDSDTITKEFQHFRETLSNIQQMIAGTEKNSALGCSILEKIDNFASTFQKNFQSHQSNISEQFETLLNKVNSQKKTTAELVEKVQKNGDVSKELGSNLQSLKKSLESLREDQERERNMMEEALKLLGTLVSDHSAKTGAEGLVDSAIQTSPSLEQEISQILRDNKLEDSQISCKLNRLEQNQGEAALKNPSRTRGKRTSNLRGIRRHKKRPLVLSQRRKHPVTNENSPPLINCIKQQNLTLPLCKHHDRNMINSQDNLNSGCLKLQNKKTGSKVAGVDVTPFDCWSQDSSSSLCPIEIEPILGKLPSDLMGMGSPKKTGCLWQLFDMDSDLEF